VRSNRAERQLIFSALGFLILAMILTLHLLQSTPPPNAPPAQTLEEVYARYLVSTRVIVGVAIVALWPLILHLSARLLRLKYPRPAYFLSLLGILLGAMAYCLTFLPGTLMVSAIILPSLGALGLLILVLRLAPRHAIAMWLLQGTCLIGFMSIAVWGLESLATGQLLDPRSELLPIYQIAKNPAPREQLILPKTSDNTFPPIQWPSSGSVWLDNRANRARIEVNLASEIRTWSLVLAPAYSQEPIAVVRNGDLPATIPTFAPTPDAYYWLTLVASEESRVAAVVHSLLPVASAARKDDQEP